MTDKIKLKTIKVTQSIGDFYIAKISPEILISMSIVDRRRILKNEKFSGIQRELKKEKVAQIKSYLKSLDATFPNSIILNTKSDFIVDKNSDFLELKIKDNAFTIIDGQHRLESFKENPVSNFDLIVTIFIDLDIDQQANIFATINSQQTKVDPSLTLNLELNSKLFTPKKMMIEIAQSFNYDNESPWYRSIKMLGSKTDGIISLAAFVNPLLDLTYPEKDYYLIRNELKEHLENPNLSKFKYSPEKYLFWDLYKANDFNSIYKILFNYFESLKKILNKDWLNYGSLLNKTTGYNAIIKLFNDIAKIGFEKSDLTYDFFYKILTPLAIMNGTINSENYGASGQKASNELYVKMKETLANNV